MLPLILLAAGVPDPADARVWPIVRDAQIRDFQERMRTLDGAPLRRGYPLMVDDMTKPDIKPRPLAFDPLAPRKPTPAKP